MASQECHLYATRGTHRRGGHMGGRRAAGR